MKTHIKITIKGDRQVGKSRLTAVLKVLLPLFGYNVTVDCKMQETQLLDEYERRFKEGVFVGDQAKVEVTIVNKDT